MTGTFGKPSAVVSLATALLAGVPAGFTIWWLVGMCVSLIQLNTTAEKRVVSSNVTTTCSIGPDSYRGLNFNWSGPWETTFKQWSVWNWHPILMTIGFGFLSVQAIIGFKALPFKHTTKKAIHGIFHFIAFGCATVAIVVVFLFKKSHGYDHLYSVHSWVGFGAYILYGLQFFFGLFMFVFPRGSDRIRAAFMPHHTYWGACIWAGTIIAIATGVLDRLTVTDLSGGPYTIDTLVPNAVAAVSVVLLWAVFWNLRQIKPRNTDYHYTPINNNVEI